MSDLVLGLAKLLADVVAPLRVGLTDWQEFEALLAEHGWDVDVAGGELEALRGAFGLVELVDQLEAAVDSAGNDISADQVAASLEALDAARAVVGHITNLDPPGLGGLPPPFNQTGFWTDLSATLIPGLIGRYLSLHWPTLFGLLHLTGVIAYTNESPVGTHRVNFTRTEIDWSQLSDVVTKPADAVNRLYAWDVAGQPFRSLDLVHNLQTAMLALGVPAATGPPRPSLSPLVSAEAVVGGEIVELEVPVIEGLAPHDLAYWKVGVVVVPVSRSLDPALPPEGLAVVPLLEGDLSTEIYFSREVWLAIDVGIDTNQSFRLRVYPRDVIIDADAALTDVAISVEFVGQPDEPWVIVGTTDGSRIELDGFRIGYALEGALSDLESRIEAQTVSAGDASDGLRLVVELSDLGFLGSATDAGRLVLGADVGLLWSNRSGFAFNGSVGIDFELPVNLSLGPLSVDRVLGGLRVAPDRISAEIAAGIGIEIGPVFVQLDRLGLGLALESNDSGNGFFGSMSPQFDLLPPTGLSLLLDAETVKGSGFLDIDRENHRYAGAFSLTVSEFRVAAFGVLQTNLPKPGPEFSLLVVLGAEFPGLQIGLGITLNGLSGMVGLHRGADADALRQELLAGTVGDLLTLEGAETDPRTFLVSVSKIFPVRPGRHLIGIGVRLRWIELVRLDLMIGIELPGPSKILLLGSVRADIEASGKALLRLRLDVLGILDFEKKLLSIDAALIDSSLLEVLNIEGGAAIRMSWGSQPYLVLSVGGFHPDFVPEPAVLPVPRRVGMSAGKPGGLIYYRLEAYFAITSNTLQFGAAAEIRVNAGPLRASGSLGFDVLVQFDPFRFSLQFRARFRVSIGGVTLAGASIRGRLSGPGPLVFRGKVCIEILFFSACWSGSLKLGGSAAQTGRTVGSVADVLRAEIVAANLATMTAQLPSVVVELGYDAVGRPVIAPDGRLTWTQTRAPFGLPLDKFEGSPLERPVVLTTTSGTGLVEEWFAPAGFADYSDAEAINLPAFERLPGGLDLSGTEPARSDSVALAVEVEEVILPDIVRQNVAVLALPHWIFAGPAPVVPLLSVIAEAWLVHRSDATEVHAGGRAVCQMWARAQEGVALPADDVVEVGGL